MLLYVAKWLNLFAQMIKLREMKCGIVQEHEAWARRTEHGARRTEHEPENWHMCANGHTNI